MKQYIIITICQLITLTIAFPSFRNAVPNGLAADRPDSGIQCRGLGHEQCSGGGARNPFGLAFEAAGFKWTTKLCRADSDGDGLTNGQELGDPCCRWTSGDGDAGLRLTDLSHPGFKSEVNNARVGCGEDAPTASPAKSKKPTPSSTPSKSKKPTLSRTPSSSMSVSISKSPKVSEPSKSTLKPSTSDLPIPSKSDDPKASVGSSSQTPAVSMKNNEPMPTNNTTTPNETPMESTTSPNQTSTGTPPTPQSKRLCGATFSNKKHLACGVIVDKTKNYDGFGSIKTVIRVEYGRINYNVSAGARTNLRIQWARVLVSTEQFRKKARAQYNFDGQNTKSFSNYSSLLISGMPVKKNKKSCCGKKTATFYMKLKICKGLNLKNCMTTSRRAFQLNIRCSAICEGKQANLKLFNALPMGPGRKCAKCQEKKSSEGK